MGGRLDAASLTAGARFRAAVREEKPLQLPGVINAFVAMLAERCGYRALYLSGAGVANSSFGLPDLGLTSLDNVAEDVRRVTGATDLPLLVDADTGFGPAHMIARAVRELARAGAAGIHIEDQAAAKRCGHRPGKAIVPREEMLDRIKAAVDAKPYADFVVMARTDALAREGLEAAVARAADYAEAGADMIFPEALDSLDQYRAFRAALSSPERIPILANITEFGVTPLFTASDLAEAGADIVLYPLTANRMMNRAALDALQALRREGTQRGLVDRMQTRQELYDVLGYLEYEEKLDELFGKAGESDKAGEGGKSGKDADA